MRNYQQFFALAALSLTTSVLGAATQQPNVVIIYGDDVGYGDVGVYGSKLIPTPHIDQLAAEGLRFTDGHCAAATCTPSRFSLLTGIHGFRNGVRILSPKAPLSIPTDILTLPKLFQQAGYATGVVGKWHLGLGTEGVDIDWNGEVKPGPLEIGFDHSFLLPITNDRVPCVYLEGHHVVNLDPADPLYVGTSKKAVEHPGSTTYPDGVADRSAMTYYENTRGHNNSVINGISRIGYMAGGKSALWDDETMTDEFVKQAEIFIADHKDEPFFLYFSSQAIHVPRAPNPRFQGVTSLGYRGDSMVEFDWATGAILQILEDNGLTENTIVIFSSDNGPVYDDGYKDGTTVHTSRKEVDRGHDGSGIWRGGKYRIFEGGTRVPFIIRWPARIEPGVSSALVNQIDLLASFAELLELQLPDDEARDSRNILPALLGDDPVGLEYTIKEAFGLSLRQGDWKYLEPQKKDWGAKKDGAELYDLKTDPSEQNNIIAAHPERAAAMAQKLAELKKSGGVRN
ncbi:MULTISPECIES: arylsulfatase [unclassified Lentimonas]|uniref:sulfatase family protein n=1 Tax=unclassified Lentimonas TaxID=2630993 RepID=UPI00132173E5|nr:MULTISPECIES: arylsulfatase [unclassified Lentimonas]CAA6693089.1 Choline-sulfatase (EC [Lentimonas sp. CC19]CAA6695677.1 Choline-sulfatase (EC [Lentimonas sp. CC10]CAA7071527.1 Choline-sulfatase (EC [Lentimonas sp. CC11]